MAQKIITITVGAGQARPRRRRTRRRFRVNLWTVAKYAALTVAGILLFRAGAAYDGNYGVDSGHKRRHRGTKAAERGVMIWLGEKNMNCFSNCKRLWAAISTRHSIAR